MTTLEIYDKSLALLTIIEENITAIEAVEDVESPATDDGILAKFYDWLLTSQTTLKELNSEIENLENMPETVDIDDLTEDAN
jgi:hypothetical protein